MRLIAGKYGTSSFNFNELIFILVLYYTQSYAFKHRVMVISTAKLGHKIHSL